MWRGLIEEYKDHLPITDKTPIVSLHEGNTPLIELKNLPQKVNIPATWYIKYEGLNPTGSFKDRGMCMAITKAKEAGSKAVICASTGNTSASAAAYAARAGMACLVMIPEGKIALGKLSQAMLHGAKVIQIEGNFDEALEYVQAIADKHPITLVNSINPYRLEGQKTAAFEIVQSLGSAPTHHSIPVGNAGNITAYWMGYNEAKDIGWSKKVPKMLGFQAAGSDPIVQGVRIKNPETIATAIRIGNPINWKNAEKARDESIGDIMRINDETITNYQKYLANLDGIFCEPASAISVAGVVAYHQKYPFVKGDVIVSTLTGHGLKDPQRAIEIAPETHKVSSNEKAIDTLVRSFI